MIIYAVTLVEILIDSATIYERARQHIQLIRPDFLNRVKKYDGEVPLFSHYQIETQIESAFQRNVSLPSGGSIVIDPTEALTSIDINSARATKGSDIEETALNTNLEAADEIARQLRLRDLGGLVVIDFIDMTPVRNQREVENRLREAVRMDRARVQIGRISRFGLLEMSRQRLSPSLAEASHHICPRCTGTGVVRDNESLALSVLRLIEEEALKDNSSQVVAVVPVAIASYLLNEKRRSVNTIESSQNVRVIIVPNSDMETPHFEVVRVRGGEEHDILSYLVPKKLEAMKEAEATEPSEADITPKKIEEPALKGFAAPAPQPASPAPTPAKTETPVKAETNEPGVVSRLFKALTSFFSTPVEEVKEEKPAEQPQNNRNNRNNRNDNRRRNPRDGNRDQQGNRDQNKNRNKPVRNDQQEEQAETKPNQRRDNRRPKQDKKVIKSNAKVAEQGQQIAAEAQVEVAAPVVEEKQTQVIKQRRQRRQLKKQVRVKDQQDTAAQQEKATQVEAKVEQDVKVAQDVVETNKPAVAEGENKEETKRRNRRTPRHLRASGQRRRRGRDRRPNPFRLRKGGVASPEMAMGKVMPKYDLAKPRYKERTRITPEVEQVALNGFACPEMAMGKVIILRDIVEDKAPMIEAAPVIEQAPIEAPVQNEAVLANDIAETTVTDAPIQKTPEVETPVVEESVVEAPVINQPVIETAMVETPVTEEPTVEAEVVETPVTEEPTVEAEVVETPVTEEPVVEASVIETPIVEDNAAPIEVPTQQAEVEVKQEAIVVAKPKATTQKLKARATSVMTKAPGPQDIKEIEVKAAPLKEERYKPKGAGSQSATSQASSGTSKTL